MKKQGGREILASKDIFSTGKDNFSDDDIYSDVLGSYTGTSADGGKPEQDADDI